MRITYLLTMKECCIYVRRHYKIRTESDKETDICLFLIMKIFLFVICSIFTVFEEYICSD